VEKEGLHVLADFTESNVEGVQL